jgi:hypothetical protein
MQFMRMTGFKELRLTFGAGFGSAPALSFVLFGMGSLSKDNKPLISIEYQGF